MDLRALYSFLVPSSLSGPDEKGETITVWTVGNRVGTDPTMGVATEAGQAKNEIREQTRMANHHAVHIVLVPGYIGEMIRKGCYTRNPC